MPPQFQFDVSIRFRLDRVRVQRNRTRLRTGPNVARRSVREAVRRLSDAHLCQLNQDDREMLCAALQGYQMEAWEQRRAEVLVRSHVRSYMDID